MITKDIHTCEDVDFTKPVQVLMLIERDDRDWFDCVISENEKTFHVGIDTNYDAGADINYDISIGWIFRNTPCCTDTELRGWYANELIKLYDEFERRDLLNEARYKVLKYKKT